MTPINSIFQPNIIKSSPMLMTSIAVATVIGRVLCACMRIARSNERSTESAGMGTRIFTGINANAARPGESPDTVSNQTIERGVKATSPRATVVHIESHIANFVSSGRRSLLFPSSASAASW